MDMDVVIFALPSSLNRIEQTYHTIVRARQGPHPLALS